MKNLISSLFSDEDKQAIAESIKQIEALIKNKVVALNEKERQKYGSINESNKLFVNKVHAFRLENPELSAPEVDWMEFDKDYTMRTFLENQIESLERILYQFKSTKTLHDFDNFQDSLIDYSYAQYKRNAKESGFNKKVSELKQFFTRSKNDTTGQEPVGN
ncbi:hypothetical protein [Galbibacter mesophilus]|uniref:hypothetical protein n=1 Tax=Galbibacter mesophilus TaxID=379069 RepID=UPI00191D1AC6|nr:hypothetical protein [Galbibacter mesophilus]MCM5663321.1 hypothetical protein [Galbibacter mesophilus]